MTLIALLVLTSCSGDEERNGATTGEQTAIWNIDPNAPPAPGSAKFTALVERLGCNDGVTGNVHRPKVHFGKTEIVVTFTVAPVTSGFHNCLGNRPAARSVNIGKPIGERRLVDGACLTGEAKSTSHCSQGAVRWSPTSP